ncbi:hypothetical protein B0H12DRAFT_1136432 [Mycena haematopus]|nr:hypothetical protein B0H12DRAFT_1136432 [Mycena haematopus]
MLALPRCCTRTFLFRSLTFPNPILYLVLPAQCARGGVDSLQRILLCCSRVCLCLRASCCASESSMRKSWAQGYAFYLDRCARELECRRVDKDALQQVDEKKSVLR